MKLLQINVCNNVLSTGRIASEIGELAIDNGWESYIVYARGFKDSRNTPIMVGGTPTVYLHGISTRFFDNCGFSLFSLPATNELIGKIKAIQPDIIHLHVIHGYFLYLPALFDYLSTCNIPVVWTVHSCWDFTGHCGYYSMVDCDKWKTGCHDCPQLRSYPASYLFDNTNQNWHRKKNMTGAVKNMTLVPVSQWLKSQLEQSFLSEKPIHVIYNGVDTNIFHTLDYDVKEKKGWKDKKVLLAVASTWEKRKRLEDYLKLAKTLPADFILVLVGLNKYQAFNLPSNIVAIERTNNISELVELYNAADVVLNLSYEETFGLTTVEGMACGTPGIVFNCTASPELVTPETGKVVEKGDIQGVIDAIISITSTGKNYFSLACRNRVLENFDKRKQFQKYIDLYKKLAPREKKPYPLLLDALYVNSGGGYILLDYLVSKLCEANVCFTLLKDVRCPSLKDENRVGTVLTMAATIKGRKVFYDKHKYDFSSVLCFGNIPTPIKMPCPVYTYFQNVNLLDIPSSYGLSARYMIWLKRQYIAHHAKYTDGWIVQTSHTESTLKKYMQTKGKHVYKMPFYKIPESLKLLKDSKTTRTDYLLVGNYYHGTKGHDTLLDAWELLSMKGFDKCLHLTISKDNEEVCKRIIEMRKNGVNVINHYTIPFDEVINLYGKSKAIIYPSINESLGLGIVEGIHAGCDVIASDLPYTYAICKPSAVFEAENSQQLADVILKYEKGNSPKSELTITNSIKDLIKLIINDKL